MIFQHAKFFLENKPASRKSPTSKILHFRDKVTEK